MFARINVVSPDLTVLSETTRWGACAVIEAAAGHNPALQAAAQQEMERGVTALLTISADLPLLHVEEVRQMAAYAACYDVVLAASRDGTGTNALFARPPLVLPYLFGIGSLKRYQDEAAQRYLCRKTLLSNGLAFDVDTIDDLDVLRQNAHADLPITLALPTGP